MGDDVRKRVRQSIEAIGAARTARTMGMPRETVLSLAAGASVREGTMALAHERVRRLDAAARE